MKYLLKNILIVPALLAKAFFDALTQVAWGISGIVLLNLVLTYMLKEKMPTEVNLMFLTLERYATAHIMLFFWCFLVLYIFFAYNDFKELNQSKGGKKP